MKEEPEEREPSTLYAVLTLVWTVLSALFFVWGIIHLNLWYLVLVVVCLIMAIGSAGNITRPRKE